MGRRTVEALVVGVALAAGWGCVRNPVTGKRQLSLVPKSQEIAMGQQAAQEVEQTLGLVQKPELQSYVSNLGMTLAKQSERPELPWHFAVIEDPTANAFALPGGFIYVTRGLITHLNSEAELAMVLGHEIGHVTAKHSVSQMSKAQLAQLGLGVGMIAVPRLQKFGQLAGAGMQLLFLRFGRDAERQADDLGFRYSLEHGYDARAGADVFRTLDKISQASGEGRVPQWLATHPNPENRVERLEKLASSTSTDWSKLQRKEEPFLAKLEGVVFGENPRQGFFRGTAFLHPEFQFQVQFPEGWKTQNTPQAVVAVSPQQDAMLVVGSAGKMSPQEALGRFLSTQGVQPGPASGSPIHGLSAATALFQAQTEQGVPVQGLVSFVSHQGQTFQLIGYTAAERFGGYGPALQSSLGSFGPLTDPTALGVQPARVSVVKLPRPMTVEEFNSAFPSTVPVQEVALLNGVSTGEKLPAGEPMKRVVGGTPVEQRQARTGGIPQAFR
jgi:predicted Zn-dependent protease